MSILSLEQQKRSLSKGKKGRYEKVAKIALDNPFPEYWLVFSIYSYIHFITDSVII